MSGRTSKLYHTAALIFCKMFFQLPDLLLRHKPFLIYLHLANLDEDNMSSRNHVGYSRQHPSHTAPYRNFQSRKEECGLFTHSMGIEPWQIGISRNVFNPSLFLFMTTMGSVKLYKQILRQSTGSNRPCPVLSAVVKSLLEHSSTAIVRGNSSRYIDLSLGSLASTYPDFSHRYPGRNNVQSGSCNAAISQEISS